MGHAHISAQSSHTEISVRHSEISDSVHIALGKHRRRLEEREPRTQSVPLVPPLHRGVRPEDPAVGAVGALGHLEGRVGRRLPRGDGAALVALWQDEADVRLHHARVLLAADDIVQPEVHGAHDGLAGPLRRADALDDHLPSRV